ncbi:hypothetical protein EXIGLDRAFT_774706 [Exidia glandulosa HHB12029]|uniref:Uncharacterized protein n=1 Tax=Exidia glandulosa HHB12029 TaxID=1314781 RepID=A0A165E988_EXIGL|nr:hypothetical protein EXIGLDRAFT_774706 [Exidia glandulosa HHB12029]
MSPHGRDANPSASDTDATASVEHAAIQKERIDAAASALADAEIKPAAADVVFAETKRRYEDALSAYLGAENAHFDVNNGAFALLAYELNPQAQGLHANLTRRECFPAVTKLVLTGSR